MNYEELIAARNDSKKTPAQMPIGSYYREQVDGKWRGMVDIKPDLNKNIVFSEALKAECKANLTLANNHQIHFKPIEENGEIKQLELELGNYLTFEQLLNDNPAVVAEKGFLDSVLKSLVEITDYLHKLDIWHGCFSPRTVFVRKGDYTPLLLSHGSFYQSISDQEAFYGEDVKYVAPEVLTHGTIDGRSDVYSIGKFMEALLESADIPMEYKHAIKKAVSESPEDRYETPGDMLNAVQKRRGTMRSVLTLVAAVVVALVCVGLYFELFPESHPVEFVKPAPRQTTDDLLDDGFSPEELGVVPGDSLGEVDEATQRDYEAKAEEIFRKKFEKGADRILSKIYNKEHMSNSEKKFMAESESTIQDLMSLEAEIGGETGLTPERTQVIASQIIERITEEKKKALGGTNSRGIQK